jgi:hypothetical protein
MYAPADVVVRGSGVMRPANPDTGVMLVGAWGGGKNSEGTGGWGYWPRGQARGARAARQGLQRRLPLEGHR